MYYKVTQTVKIKQKISWSTLTGKWSRINSVGYFSVKIHFFFELELFELDLFYLFNVMFSEFFYIFIKNWPSYNEKLFFCRFLNVRNCVWYFWTCPASKYMGAVIFAYTQFSWLGKKQPLAFVCKKGIFRIWWQLSETTATKSTLCLMQKIFSNLDEKQEIKQ